MKNLLLLPLLLLLPWLGRAQAFTVKGVVLSQADRIPLPGVMVLERGTANGTTTDAQGRFALTTTRPHPRLVVSAVGFVTQEIPIARSQGGLVVRLAADSRELAEVVVTGYASARAARAMSGSVSGVAGRVPGVSIRGSGYKFVELPARAKPARGRPVPAPVADTAGAAPVPVRAGTLTAGELNDFGKWQLWPDVARQDLSEWRGRWQISPLERYTAQLVTEDGFPVVGAPVFLKDERDSLIWQAQSDNTGKCELWHNLFGAAKPGPVATLQAVVGGQTYVVQHPTRFQEGLNFVRVRQPCQVPAAVDVALVVDATGSMGDEIEYLQTELRDVIAKAQDSLRTTTLRLGSVFYRDTGDEYLTRHSDISANIQQTLQFIGRQGANGGGDTPEAVEQALAVALNELSWSPQARARLLLLILDAPPHENPAVLAALRQSIRQAAARGIRIIPIAASGIDKSGEYLMRCLALATNGTYVFLTDDSGVGEAHIKPTTDQFEVEPLNRLLLRLMVKYAATASCQNPVARPAKALAGRYPAAAAADTTRRAQAGTWQCYPIPTADVLHVEVDREVKELFMTDVTGKLVLRAAPNQRRATFRLGGFPAGVYFLTFFTGAGWEKVKIVVSR